MRTLPYSDSALAEALAVLRAGGTVAHETETCYGFACDLSNPSAVANLFAIKQRPSDQPVSALFSSLAQAKEYVVWSARAETLAAKHLPGPLTLILPLRSEATNILHVIPASDERIAVSGQRSANDGLSTIHYPLSTTVGLRLSSHPVASALAAAFGSPLSTTSANLHGAPNPYSAVTVAMQFEGKEHQPDLILDAGELSPTPPSTVIDLTEEGEEVRRKGGLTVG